MKNKGKCGLCGKVALLNPEKDFKGLRCRHCAKATTKLLSLLEELLKVISK